MNIILIGFKKSGKTTCGKELAEKLQRPFIDLDELIERLYKKDTGKNLLYYEIFEKVGEEEFRFLESQALETIKYVKSMIIALGGGTVLQEENLKILKKMGTAVYLEVPKEILRSRILSDRIPKFFDPKDPEASFEEMYHNRKEIYSEVADRKIFCKEKTIHTIVDELQALVKNG